MRLAAAAVALALLVLPQASAAQAPSGFIGISPEGIPGEADFRLMERAGVRSLRLPLFWSQVEQISPFLVEPDWKGFDRAVEVAARHRMRVMPVVSSSPPWVAAEARLEPTTHSWQLQAWTSFLRRAVQRYGAGGTLWRDDEELPYQPVRRWEVWNEPNIVTFGRADPERFARLVRASGRAIHGADPGAKAILGGLFGRPLQVPPNVSSGDFLSRLYRARRVKPHFDGVALHPYVAAAAAMRGQILNLRRVMRVHHDAGTPIYVTELGWGSASFETRWERGPQGQARELDRAFSMLTRHRRPWRVGGVWWFSLIDTFGSCQFCDSSGLLTEAREAKPAWYRFNEWTGGEADIVPAASLDD